VRFSSIRVSGPLADHIHDLGAELLRQGYTFLSCRNLLRLASHLSRWLEQRSLGLRELTDDQVDLRFPRFHGHRQT